MNLQTLRHLKGEVEFRKKLAIQHVSGEMLLPDYYDKEQHDKILLERVDATLRDVKELEKRTRLSPFVELGAERCQRSLVLTNDFKARGFAVDISFHQLKTAEHFAKVFNRPILPYRVCCDVNNLPFRENSVPFVFCYEFLHHFPSPKPIMQQVYRILSDGMFFVGEEPFKRPKLSLYRQSNKIYSKAALRKSKTRRFVESFFSEDHCDEREHGIVENDDISLREWIDALSIFDAKEVHLSSLGSRIRTELNDHIAIKNLMNLLLGGGIKGYCTKKDRAQKNEISNLTDLLLCPNCATKATNRVLDQPPLIQRSGSLECALCGSLHPVIDDVTFLLPTHLSQELYPGILS